MATAGSVEYRSNLSDKHDLSGARGVSRTGDAIAGLHDDALLRNLNKLKGLRLLKSTIG